MLRGKIVVALLAVVCVVEGFYYSELTADQDFLVKQKKIYNLIYHVPQSNIVNPEQFKEGQSYSIEANIDSYTNKDSVNHFLEMYKFGLLPRGELFSLYYPRLQIEMKSLFKVFFYAKDFDTFYKTALWARVHINEAEFIYALYQAVIMRPDTVYIQLPPPYEFYPFAFFNSEVIEAAKNIKLSNKFGTSESNTYIIRANYSGWYTGRDYDYERKLNYFTEDIGLNAYYFFFRLDQPFWLSGDEFPIKKSWRGEQYLYGHKMLMNRYNLERLANGLDKVEHFDWSSEIYPGYYPTMAYHNGFPFPQRPQWSKIPHYKYQFLYGIREYESRVASAIDLGYVIDADGTHHKIYTPEGLNIIGNIIEGNADTCNRQYYGSIEVFGRRILGYNVEPKNHYQINPSALETMFSCLRDPMFYRLYQKIVSYYHRYKETLTPYAKDEIVYPGLKLESVVVDKLVTFFDEFDTTISNGIPVVSQKDADTFHIKVRQQRLNNKHFSVHFGLNSDKEQKVAIQMFLGPKYDAQHNLLDFLESYKYFYEMDYWVTDVVAGMNKLERSSHDFFFLMPDAEPSEVFFKRVEKAIDGTDKFTYKQNIHGFPERLIIPKGRRGGQVYQLFVYVSPVAQPVTYKSRVFGDYQFAKQPMGFPLDRPIYHSTWFQESNMLFKDVTIYFKTDVDPNATI